MKKFIALLFLLILCACNQNKKLEFKNTDVTGLGYATDFSLPDFNGKMRRLADFQGKVVLMFFGYTQCPDVCPTTMAELSTVMRELGTLSDQVQVIFVSLDPEHDTREMLAQYVPAFDQRFLGLVGSHQETQKIAKDFKIFYEKVPGKNPGSYTLDHSSGSYVFDKNGRVRLFIRFNQGPEPIVHDLKLLLK
ncbi:MAG: photosynthetic protein synthase [Solimicrobium sp.]|jgi:protein SCO1/2|nr:photosynthetic protein synthase [Solimicrobium sp.]